MTATLRATAKNLRSIQGKFAGWIQYFQWNNKQLLEIPWNDLYQVSEHERKRISSSIRVFQLGESSEGHHLQKAAEKYASRAGEKDLIQAIKLFIAEEQRHARYLAYFMTQQKIQFAKRQWTDTAFRTLRRLWNLEICIVVLLTAELVARLYYKALQAATQSSILKNICAQLLRDEVAHVHFHTAILGSIRKHRSRRLLFFQDALYRTFHNCTLLVVGWP